MGIMAYWVASGNRTNWEVVKKHNIWGVPKRSQALHGRVKIGDTILIYTRAEIHGKEIYPSSIRGEFIVTETFIDNSQIFTPTPQMGNESFPYRFRLKPVKIYKNPVELKPLISELIFITNKKMWSGHLRRPMRLIPEEDYKSIIKAGNAVI